MFFSFFTLLGGQHCYTPRSENSDPQTKVFGYFLTLICSLGSGNLKKWYRWCSKNLAMRTDNKDARGSKTKDNQGKTKEK